MNMHKHEHRHDNQTQSPRTETMTSNRSNFMNHFLSYLLLFLLLLVPTQLEALNTDGVLLLSFKYSILNDPFSVLDNWKYDDVTPCSWTGVTCRELGEPSTPDMFRVTSLVLPNKQLLGSISPSLFSIPSLERVDLSNNSFNGSLPDSVFNATALRVLSLGNNKFSGELPENIGGMASLQLLNLSANAFAGRIPRNLTLLQNLMVVSLTSNDFTGDIPTGFETAQILDFSSNLLSGSLPPNFGGKSLQYLNLSHNNISGKISPGFAEKIPAKAIIDLSFNKLAGPIPQSLSLLNQRTESYIGNIDLCGKPLKNLCSVPSTLSNPPNTSTTTSPAIAVMPKTTGSTNPSTESQTQTTESKLKASTIVGIIVADITGLAILGIFILYVYQLRKRRRHQEYSTFNVLKECLEKNDASLSRKSKQQPEPGTLVEFTASPAGKKACSSCIIGGYDETSASDVTGSESDMENQVREQKTLGAFRRADGGRLKQSTQTQLVVVDGEIRLELETLLKASAYVLGSGGSGIVYKAVLENGAAFAVRRIGAESCSTAKFKEFEREVRAIAKLRHPNLVRVRGFCWGGDEKLLICDYVPNGSLASSISRKPGFCSSQGHLSFETRLKIARGIARGLAYAHDKKHVHGNIKPNNILLSPQSEPIITDLGLSRLLNPAYKTSAHESHMAGPSSSPSAGPTNSLYQPPESSKNPKPNPNPNPNLNPKWDVYSFGVILLELLAGRVFSMDRDLGQWPELTGPDSEDENRVLRLADMAIRADLALHKDAALACFRLGFGCVCSLPEKRPSMKEVLQVLQKVAH